MKKICSIMIVSFLVSGFLSGCGLIDKQNNSVDISKTSDISDTAEKIQKTPVDPDGEKNSATINEALKAGDSKLCATISNQNTQKRCEQTVQANLITTEAVEKSDKSICEKIEIEQYLKECQTIIANKLQTEEYAKQAIEKVNLEDAQRLSIESQAMESSNASICDQIKTPSQTASCKYNVLANKANKENNAALCDQIGDAVLINTCKEFANQK